MACFLHLLLRIVVKNESDERSKALNSLLDDGFQSQIRENVNVS